MKVHVKKALQKLFFFCPQRNNQKADRLCTEFSPTPNSSAQQVRPSSISNSIPPYSVTPSFPKNFITPRSGSTEQLTNTVMIITMVFQDEPQGYILSYICRTLCALSISKIFVDFFLKPILPFMVGESFQICRFVFGLRPSSSPWEGVELAL